MINFLINEPEQSVNANLILAHGAGALMDSAFMNTVAESIAKKGIRVWRFEFPYMCERRETGKKRPPNTQKVLLESWREAFCQVKHQLDEPLNSEGHGNQEPIFIGGKSMGGRMASLLADELQPSGLICLGYPFHALGKPEKPRTEHLAEIATATLILQGTRDPMGNQERVSDYKLSNMINIIWLEDGDHDFKPRVKSGLTHQQNMQVATQRISDFVALISKDVR
ncbi:alpha/beta family hydrolase [Alkalimarinus alittae]|uniref:Dienelactone hydrolase family protein n=1 Tax=Alkalimarinus alittae TaxID=2961619 RepID=A0ABY6N1R3_9ALTE|nr:alpha/beta family hydrolase [Alkalimarinus alittae]UZE95994.1 dienelactone hydrolase family protein [Alkalimarinus alittae]